jgi:hypothetical protein
MSRPIAKRSSLFLLELIVAILFFALAASVCVRFFVRAHNTSEDSSVLTSGVMQASSVAELIRYDGDIEDSLSQEFPDGQVTVGSNFTFTIYYDENWQECQEESGAYVLTVECSQDGNMRVGEISVDEVSGSHIYDLEVKKYMKKEAL